MKGANADQRVSPLKQARIGLRVASGAFGVLSIFHVLRFWSDWDLQVANVHVGPGVSAAAAFVSAGLSLWWWKLAVGLNRFSPPRE